MNGSCRFSCFILLLPVHRCGRDCREIITEAACTSTRLWRPIMPRGAPRGHGIFCQSVEGSEKTASVFRCSLFFLLFNSGVSRSAPSLSCSRRDSRRRSNPVAIRKTRCISNCQEASNRQEFNIDVEHVSFIVKFLSRLTFRYIERIDMPRTLVSDFINCIDT